MEYLKTYKLFEGLSIPRDIKQDINDMMLELNIDGKDRFAWYFKEPYELTYPYLSEFNIIIHLKGFQVRPSGAIDYTGEKGAFRFSQVKEVLWRIKDYLGDCFVNCGILYEGWTERKWEDITEETIWNYDQRLLNCHMISNILIKAKIPKNITEGIEERHQFNEPAFREKVKEEVNRINGDIAIEDVKLCMIDLIDDGICDVVEFKKYFRIEEVSKDWQKKEKRKDIYGYATSHIEAKIEILDKSRTDEYIAFRDDEFLEKMQKFYKFYMNSWDVHKYPAGGHNYLDTDRKYLHVYDDPNLFKYDFLSFTGLKRLYFSSSKKRDPLDKNHYL